MSQTETVNPTITKNFTAGWNMFGYPCMQSLDLVEALSSIIDKVIIVKNNNGSVYMPEFGFNGIGYLESGEGYQIKLSDTEYGFSFCESINWPNIEIQGCSDCEAANFDPWVTKDDGSCNYDSDGDGIADAHEIAGCQDSLGCNYDESATDSGECSYAQDGYDCEGDWIESYYPIRDTAFLSWLQSNHPSLIVNDSLDIDAASVYSGDIYIESTSIESLDGLQYFVRLGILEIRHNNNLTSIPELSGLSNLHQLYIYNNDVLASIPELTGLNNMIHLYIYNNDVLTSIPELSELSNLEVFDVSDNYVLTSIPELLELSNLKLISISNNDALSSIPELSGLSNLTNIHISNNDALSSIPELSGLSILTNIHISNNDALSSIPELSGLSNLCCVSIFDNDALECIVGGYPSQSAITGSWPPICSYGCMDSLACNYNPEANMADGSCEYATENYDCADECLNDTDLDGVCNELEVVGCKDITACNYNESATDEGECIFALENYDCQGLCIGFTIENIEYFECYNDFTTEASCNEVTTCEWIYSRNWNGEFYEPYSYCGGQYEIDNSSCVTTVLGCTDELAFNYNSSANTNDGSCVAVVEGCTDETACNFYPEANMADGSIEYFECYNDFTTEASCNEVTTCEWIYSRNWNGEFYEPYSYCGGQYEVDNSSCEYPEQGYDCDGYVTAEIGDVMEGGYLFYIDETGKHGLVAAMEDLHELQFGLEWGCTGEEVEGADGTIIGTGYQNTLDVVNQGCATYYEIYNGSITAAQAALDAEINGYDDWYLPSKDELLEMYNTIGNGGSEGNIGDFGNYWFWSSSENGITYTWGVDFIEGEGGAAGSFHKEIPNRVRVIRSF
jgi:hypothetical protein